GVGGSGTENHEELLAHVAQELEQVEADEAHNRAQHKYDENGHGDVEETDEIAELSQRADSVFADRERDGAEHPERRQPHDEHHGLEQHHAAAFDDFEDQLSALADHRQGAAEDDREQQHLYHVG